MSRTSKLWNYGIAIVCWGWCLVAVCRGQVFPQWSVALAYGCLTFAAIVDWLTTYAKKEGS
jgi:hypothetical protein